MKTQEISKWLTLLEQELYLFTTPDLEQGIEFLEKARQKEKGWGLYANAGTDLHQSALVIQALFKSNDKKILNIVSDASSYILGSYSDKIEQLNFVGLSDLLSVVNSEKVHFEEGFVKKILGLMRNAFSSAMDNNLLSVRDISSGLVAIIDSKMGETDLINLIANDLTKFQKQTGAFIATAGGNESFIATAWAIHALVKIGKEFYDSLSRAVNFLQVEIAKSGWDIGGKKGAYAHVMVLLALSESPNIEYDLIRDGVNTLLIKANKDGSWGDLSGEIGNIEITAIGVMALAAAGRNCFVPFRMAKTAVTKIQALLQETQLEGNQLKEEFNKKVQADCGQVRKERDASILENKKLSQQTELLMKEIERMKFELDYRFNFDNDDLIKELYIERSKEEFGSISQVRRIIRIISTGFSDNITFVTVVIAGVLLIPIGIRFFGGANTGSPAWIQIFSIAILLTVTLLIGVQSYLTHRNRIRRNEIIKNFSYRNKSYARSIQPISNFRSRFFDIVNSMPSSLREEIIYTLFKELIDAPPEIGLRYIEDFTLRVRIPSDQREELILWVHDVMKLDPRDRRVIFEQIRKIV